MIFFVWVDSCDFEFVFVFCLIVFLELYIFLYYVHNLVFSKPMKPLELFQHVFQINERSREQFVDGGEGEEQG